MSTTRETLKVIEEKLRIAQATAFVLQHALTNGETDLEQLSSDVLEKHRETLTECYDDICGVTRPPARPPQRAKPTGKPKRQPALRVVEAEKSDRGGVA
jgi:hypothetical protein